MVIATFAICSLTSGVAPALAAPLAQTAEEPQVTARAAIVVEYPSGRVLYSKAAHDHLAPASTTKILTSILAIEYGNMDDDFVAADEDLVGE
ncbi:MAG TPA: D-alanyl-D-alanine carboxypeptidase, partial [Chloroflexia bacterium]|nr:D-alanyl-D-alanine carboxypeptidase [Chloroflexia bacterium]